MIRWLIILGVCGVLAFCGATVPLGKYTFFQHVGRIWSSEPMTDLKDGVKDKAAPAADKAKRFVEGGMDAVKKDPSGSGQINSGSGSAAHKPAPK
jgi:hypothetical protein